MTTLWVVRFFFFVRAADVIGPANATRRDQIADCFANNGSLQIRAQERDMFTQATRLSLSGAEPAQILAWNSAVKPAMRDALRTLIQSLPQSRYYVVANTNVPERGWLDGQLLLTDSPSAQARIGQLFTWQDALADVFAERGLQVIVSEGTP